MQWSREISSREYFNLKGTRASDQKEPKYFCLIKSNGKEMQQNFKFGSFKFWTNFEH